MKLLLVDDHAVVREGVRRMLSCSIEAVILDAHSIETALAVFRAEKPEVVILGLNLPGAGGLDLLKRLLAEAPRTRRLAIEMNS